MALRPGNPFYFLFSATDQGLVDAATVQIDDVKYSDNPATIDPYPQSLRIQFSLKTPGGGPKLRPLGPGLLTFRPDVVPGKAVPTAAQATAANYANWPTTGRLRLAFSDPDVISRLAALTGLPVVPSDIWYSNVLLTQSFLFQTLPQLPVKKVIGGKGSALAPNAPGALGQIVAGFLMGNFSAQVVAGAQSSDDSQSTLEMPSLAPTSSGGFDFYISTAFAAPPFDGEEKDYENANAVSDNWEPAHPRNGAIPPRLVYRALRNPAQGNLIDGQAGNAIADKVLDGQDSSPAYFPVRFTRIWKPAEDRSVHFPSQVVNVTPQNQGVQAFKQRLASHGILFIAMTPLQQLGGWDFEITLTNPSNKPDREMWWLAGGIQDIWRFPAANVPVTITVPHNGQQLQTIPHILLRRRMGQEVIYDRKARPIGVGASCTYFSLRRTVRALVNNRIAGGRLNFEVFYPPGGTSVRGKNSPTTRSLVRDALGAAPANVILDGGPNHRAGDGIADATQQFQAIGAEAVKLIPVLEQLFPDLVVPQPNGGSPDPGWTIGKTGYFVWQSAVGQFEDNSLKRAFDPAWIGGGGAGALLVWGMASNYQVDPDHTIVRQPGENDIAFRSDIAQAVIAAALEPGAALQFWDKFSDLALIRNHNASPPKNGKPNSLTAEGHSPLFLRFDGPAGNHTGIVVLDQGGETTCTVTGADGQKVLPWYGHRPDAWFAAMWGE